MFGFVRREWFFSSSFKFRWTYFSLPQLALDLARTPMLPDSSQPRSLISHCQGTVPSIRFVKHINFEHSVSSSHPVKAVITSRREEGINDQTKVSQHLIISQFASSCQDSQCALDGWCCPFRPQCSSSFFSYRKYECRWQTQNRCQTLLAVRHNDMQYHSPTCMHLST